MVWPNILESDDLDVMLHPVKTPKWFLFVTFGRRLADSLRTFVENLFRIKEKDV